MYVKDIFKQLSQGEFRPLALGGTNESGITRDNWEKVLPHLNLALTALHKRFPLRLETVNVQMYAHIPMYKLDPKYSQSNAASNEPYKYIKDSEFYPFTDADQVLVINKVFLENGEEAILNDENARYSLFTPSPNVIQVPYNDENNAISVEYRANHPKIEMGDDLLDVQLDLSMTYLQPLLMFIGSRVYASHQSDQGSLGNQYGSKYELACREIEQFGLINKPNTTNTKLEKNGWV